MKKIVITSVFALFLLVACGKREAVMEEDFMKDFTLDLSGLDIDFYKPYVQSYNSEIQRDSIIHTLAEGLTESVKNNDGTEQTESIKALITVSKDSNTITTQLKKTEEVDFSSWNDLGICYDTESFNLKMNEIIAQNPSAEFGIKRDLRSTEINLYYNEK